MNIYVLITRSLHGYNEYVCVYKTREEAEDCLRTIGGFGRIDVEKVPDGTTQIHIATIPLAGGDDLAYQGVFLDYDSAKRVATNDGIVQSPLL
jgi:hypothetical protein